MKSDDDISKAMMENHGNVALAAQDLGLNKKTVYDRIHASKKLKALYMDGGAQMPGEQEQMLREVEDNFKTLDPADQSIVHTIKAMNVELLVNGYEKAGVSKETLDKVRVLGEFEKFAGNFIVGALQTSHSIAVYQELKLLEFAEKELAEIEKEKDFKQRQELKKNWLKSLELGFKAYDRVAHGTEIMARLTDVQKKKKRKPGFAPLTDEIKGN